MKKILAISIICVPFLTGAQATSTNIYTTSISDLCSAVNSINVNSSENIKRIQNYLKIYFFDKLMLTGVNDVQTKFYIKEFQSANSLKPTGTLTVETLQFIRKTNNCFDLDKRISKIRTATGTVKRVTQLELLNKLLENYVYAMFGGSATSTNYTNTVTVTNAN